MYAPMPSHRFGTLSRKAWSKIAKAAEGKKAVAIGPGLGVNTDTKVLVKNAVLKLDAPMVLDADALNALSVPDLKKRKASDDPHAPSGRNVPFDGPLHGEDSEGPHRRRPRFRRANRVFLVLKGSRQ
jgi:NAD(P)H-hydrate epimerase